jgi:hypothetical protein
MIYLLEFLGLLSVAIALAASPLLIRLYEHLLPRRESGERVTASPIASTSRSNGSAELSDEIRRLTHVLEMDNRAPRR